MAVINTRYFFFVFFRLSSHVHSETRYTGPVRSNSKIFKSSVHQEVQYIENKFIIDYNNRPQSSFYL
jgi:hypothetical protein